MFRSLPLTLSDDLRLSLGGCTDVVLTPRQGLNLAETLARKSFRAAMTEEAVRHGVPLDKPIARPRPKVTA